LGVGRAAPPTTQVDAHRLGSPLRQLKSAQLDLLPPTIRVQTALHPWVAYGVMPLFALANAGVVLEAVDLSNAASRDVALGVIVALVAGKPLGIVCASWLAVRLGWCRLPPDVDWKLMALVGCLGGIGFTMAIFIANLAFPNETLLEAAKLAVLVASATAALCGVVLGYVLRRQKRLTPGRSAVDATARGGAAP
jgi:NhaA family Na+:H+ antiporter